MSGVGAPSSMGLNIIEQKQAMTRTDLLSSSMPPLPGSSGQNTGETLKLPSLTRSARPRTSMIPLSISEPSLFAPVQRAVLDGFPRRRHPSIWKRTPSLSICKSCENTNGQPQSYQPMYTHFSQPIKPVSKQAQSIPRARRLTASQCGLRPLIKQYGQAPHVETLSIRGTPCLPSRPSLSKAAKTLRTQLHVFLPVEGAGEEQDKDNESVDEGFMDEMDNKCSFFKPHREKSKIPTQPKSVMSLKPNLAQSET